MLVIYELPLCLPVVLSAWEYAAFRVHLISYAQYVCLLKWKSLSSSVFCVGGIFC